MPQTAEGNNAVKWTKLSCHDFVDNQVRLSAYGGFALACNLGNFLRRPALPRSVKHWSLIPTYVGTSGEAHQDLPAGRQVGAKVIAHALYVIVGKQLDGRRSHGRIIEKVRDGHGPEFIRGIPVKRARDGREPQVIWKIPAHILAPDGCPLQPNIASLGNSE